MALVLVLSVLIATVCSFGPQVVFGRFAVFDYYTLIFVVHLGFLGAQVFGMGLLRHLRCPRLLKGLATKLLDLHEGVLSGSSQGLPQALSAVLASLPGVGRSTALPTWPM